MRQRDVAARIREQGSRVPCLDELKAFEVFAARDTGEGLLDAEAEVADAVGDVDYAGEFFEVGKEGGGDGVISRRMLLGEGSLLFRTTKDGEDAGGEVEEETAKQHGCALLNLHDVC